MAEPMFDVRQRSLAGCAVYPEIAWLVTLGVGQALGRLGGTSNRSAGPALARFARLPWFRHGSMPDWLRLALLAELPAADRIKVRRVIDALLAESAHDDLSG